MCCIAQFGCPTGGPHAAKNNLRAVGCSWGVFWRAGLIWHLLLVTLIFLRLNTKQKAFNMLYMCWRHHPEKQKKKITSYHGDSTRATRSRELWPTFQKYDLCKRKWTQRVALLDCNPQKFKACFCHYVSGVWKCNLREWNHTTYTTY